MSRKLFESEEQRKEFIEKYAMEAAKKVVRLKGRFFEYCMNKYTKDFVIGWECAIFLTLLQTRFNQVFDEETAILLLEEFANELNKALDNIGQIAFRDVT